jgi:hypothetical protein
MYIVSIPRLNLLQLFVSIANIPLQSLSWLNIPIRLALSIFGTPNALTVLGRGESSEIIAIGLLVSEKNYINHCAAAARAEDIPIASNLTTQMAGAATVPKNQHLKTIELVNAIVCLASRRCTQYQLR